MLRDEDSAVYFNVNCLAGEGRKAADNQRSTVKKGRAITEPAFLDGLIKILFSKLLADADQAKQTRAKKP